MNDKNEDAVEVADEDVIMSPLCRRLEQDGKFVEVEIYRDKGKGWMLKVVDEFNNATTWEDEFKTDQAALDEVLDTLAQDGIAVLIGIEGGFPELL